MGDAVNNSSEKETSIPDKVSATLTLLEDGELGADAAACSSCLQDLADEKAFFLAEPRKDLREFGVRASSP